MSVLRVLSLPLTLFTFSALYSLSSKAPQAVEIASLMLSMVLPAVLIVRLIRRLI